MSGSILPGEPEAFSLFGRPLYRTPLRPEVLDQQIKLYQDALRSWEEDPDDTDNVIWLGRRTAYLGRFREALAIYSVGIDRHPEEPRFYRHRGHRFISIRLFERAVEGFERRRSSWPGHPTRWSQTASLTPAASPKYFL